MPLNISFVPKFSYVKQIVFMSISLVVVFHLSKLSGTLILSFRIVVSLPFARIILVIDR